MLSPDCERCGWRSEHPRMDSAAHGASVAMHKCAKAPGLTIVQTSALVELRVHGSLSPSSRAFGGPNGRRAFARRTLQALVDAGHAEWRPGVRRAAHGMGPETYDAFVTEVER